MIFILLILTIIAKTGIASKAKGTKKPSSITFSASSTSIIAGNRSTNEPYVRLYTVVRASQVAMLAHTATL